MANKFTVNYLPSCSMFESHWEIERDCLECDGTGVYEQTKGGVFNDSPEVYIYTIHCKDCDEGKITFDIPEAQYENVTDLLEDYPNSNVTLYVKEKNYDLR